MSTKLRRQSQSRVLDKFADDSNECREARDGDPTEVRIDIEQMVAVRRWWGLPKGGTQSLEGGSSFEGRQCDLI